MAALKWKGKSKASSCLPVIHQDCCFKAKRKKSAGLLGSQIMARS
jgi:hypothetical protein